MTIKDMLITKEKKSLPSTSLCVKLCCGYQAFHAIYNDKWIKCLHFLLLASCIVPHLTYYIFPSATPVFDPFFLDPHISKFINLVNHPPVVSVHAQHGQDV